MTDLSPAAQAVLDAMYGINMDFNGENSALAAAAIRAAADQVLPDFDEPDWGACDQMRCDIELYTDHQRKRQQLLAIAAELKGVND